MTTNYHLLFGILWLASLLATLAAFAGAATGSFALPAQVPSMWDLFLPLLIAVAEFLLFAMLVPQIVGLTTERAAVTFWFFSMAAFGLLAAAAITRARLVFRQASYAEDLDADISWYLSRLRRDTAGASTAAVLGIGGGTLTVLFPGHAVWIAYGFAGFIVLTLSAAVVSHGRTAHRWRTTLAKPQEDK